MNTMQRKLYADAALDLITSLDNDLQSLTGQADNCLKELDDPTKDDYEARNKAYGLKDMVNTAGQKEIVEIEQKHLRQESFSQKVI